MGSLHVTMLYAGILGLLLIVLSFNLLKNWVRASASGEGHNDNDLRRAEALVSSFTDYVPLCLILLGLVESSGAPRLPMHLLGMILVAARLMHAFGSNRTKASDSLRFFGAQLTYLVLTITSFACLYVYAVPKVIF
jgi:uncharacterized membrane protein YecN with MAPEG domain